MFNIEDCSKLTLKILSELNRRQSIPLTKNAVIAGGAVCNLLHHFLNKENGPVNDIDIFVFHPKKESISDLNLDGAIQDYNFEIKSKKNKKYNIISTTRDGLINYIHVEIDHEQKIEELTKLLLENFDINATKGAIILKSKKMIVLDEFIDFINNKQILATSIETPIKTILRLLKKKKELNCFLNQNHLLAMYQFSAFKKTVIINENFLKFKEELLELKYLILPIKLSNGLVNLRSIQKFINFHKNESKIVQYYNGKILIPIFESYFSNSKKYSKYLKIRPFFKVLMMVLFNGFDQKTKRDFNPKNLVLLETLLSKVPELTPSLVEKDLNESSIIALKIFQLKKDNLIFDQFLGFLGSVSNIDSSNIKDHFVDFEKILNNPKKQIKPALSVKNKKVKELLSKDQLELEGLIMNHCVGGYFEKVKSEDCRIFSIMSNNKRSTLEIKKVNGKWIGVQHFGKANSFPNNSLRLIAVDLLNEINESL